MYSFKLGVIVGNLLLLLKCVIMQYFSQLWRLNKVDTGR